MSGWRCSDEEMNVSKSQQGAITIINVQGPMVEEGLDILDALMDECVASGLLRIVFDMKRVPFVDSAGLEKIQAIVSDLGKRGGDVRIASLNDVCSDIFGATRLESFVQVFNEREAAVRSLL